MKRLVVYKLFIFLAFLALVGCAEFNVPPNYELQKDKQVGLLVMSVNHNTRAITLHYENMVNHKHDVVMTSTVQDKMDFRQPKGRLIVAELPAGEYQFYQWQTDIENFQYTSPLFSAPFTIEQGKPVYVGNLNIKAKIIYPFMKVEYEHTISNKSERDIALLKKKYPKLDISELEVRTSKITPGIVLQRK